MSDVDLLVFGCVVTFIGVAGAYMYVRESFTAGAEPTRESNARNADAVDHEISEVA
jgi:uncharacterized protein (UPF0333 family)